MGTASLAVVGVLLERGAKEPNPAVQLALDAAPRQANVKVQVRALVLLAAEWCVVFVCIWLLVIQKWKVCTGALA